MESFFRYISYVDYYRDGEKIKNVGFLRWKLCHGRHYIEIQLKDIRNLQGSFDVQEKNTGKVIGKIIVDKGIGNFQKEFPSMSASGENYIDTYNDRLYLDDVEGFLIQFNSNEYLSVPVKLEQEKKQNKFALNFENKDLSDNFERNNTDVKSEILERENNEAEYEIFERIENERQYEIIEGKEKERRSEIYEGTEKERRSGIYEGTEKERRSGIYEGKEKERRSGIYEGTEKERRSGIYKGTEKERRSEIYEGKEKERQSGIYKGKEIERRSEIYEGKEIERRPEIIEGKKKERRPEIIEGKEIDSRPEIFEGTEKERRPEIIEGKEIGSRSGIYGGTEKKKQPEVYRRIERERKSESLKRKDMEAASENVLIDGIKEKYIDPTAGKKIKIIEPIHENKWKQLCKEYPQVHPFPDKKIFLSIKPEDFIILQQGYQKLVHNSFLLHGFYNYGHMILGKLSEEEEAPVYVGVPGVYYEREKQAAQMFGFVGFESTEHPVQAGSYGYYMIEVEI